MAKVLPILVSTSIFTSACLAGNEDIKIRSSSIGNTVVVAALTDELSSYFSELYPMSKFRIGHPEQPRKQMLYIVAKSGAVVEGRLSRKLHLDYTDGISGIFESTKVSANFCNISISEFGTGYKIVWAAVDLSNLSVPEAKICLLSAYGVAFKIPNMPGGKPGVRELEKVVIEGLEKSDS